MEEKAFISDENDKNETIHLNFLVWNIKWLAGAGYRPLGYSSGLTGAIFNFHFENT